MHPRSDVVAGARQQLQLVAVSCALILIAAVVLRGYVDELESQLLAEVGRRKRAEREARKKDDELDGALEHIHKLKTDDDGDDDEPA